MAFEGFFDLQTPEHLLRKLEWEYARWEPDHLNVYLAWNFFITAEHLPDWLSHPNASRLEGLGHKAFKRKYPDTRICSSLASGCQRRWYASARWRSRKGSILKNSDQSAPRSMGSQTSTWPDCVRTPPTASPPASDLGSQRICMHSNDLGNTSVAPS